jgi:hypothetical protein
VEGEARVMTIKRVALALMIGCLVAAVAMERAGHLRLEVSMCAAAIACAIVVSVAP